MSFASCAWAGGGRATGYRGGAESQMMRWLPVAIFLPLLVSAALPSDASDAEWRWIWVTPDYIRPSNSRTWTAEPGTAKIVFQGRRFIAHLENANHNPAYDLTGVIHGTQVAATAKPTDSDADARSCSGRITRDKTSERINLLCDDGAFIGLI